MADKIKWTDMKAKVNTSSASIAKKQFALEKEIIKSLYKFGDLSCAELSTVTGKSIP